MPQLLCAFESALEPPRHVVVTGRPEVAGIRGAGRGGAREPGAAQDPHRARRDAGIRGPGFPSSRPGWPGWAQRDDSPTAYVCEEFICKAPARTPDELRRALGRPGVAP